MTQDKKTVVVIGATGLQVLFPLRYVQRRDKVNLLFA